MIAFAFLDSSYKTPQHLQMMMFKQYAEKTKMKLAFYGGELVGSEQEHYIFESYMNKKLYRNYIFFTVEQFIDNNGRLQESILKKAIKSGIRVDFANESLNISKPDDLFMLKTMILSRHAFEDARNFSKEGLA